MKFETTTDQLLSAVATAARFVERRANLPVLAGILITADGNRIILRATNLECGVEISVPGKVSQDGTVAVPGNILAGFLSNSHGKSVTAELKGELLKLHTERAEASIKTIPHNDFPVLPRVPASNSFTLKAGDLVKAVRGVAYCASLSAVKPELQSVLLWADAGKLTAVATDSFLLAEKTVPLRKGGRGQQLLLFARNAAA